MCNPEAKPTVQSEVRNTASPSEKRAQEWDFTQSPIEIKWSDHPHRKRPRDEDDEPPAGVA